MAEWVLLLGGDRGDLARTFAQAEARITERVGPIRSRSRDHWTEPWQVDDEALFLNRALVVESTLAPAELMNALLGIERELGRHRAEGPRYAPRIVDIDVLFQGDQVIDDPRITVPHPRVHERAFALAPAADVVPALVHPLQGATVLTLLDRSRA
ncbi:MAG TPA: 2-amino-4-hydroxy-6-hydroxymethyldihydropteridine diphosphokinase [Flavobacteriales bacterium]|jgi:2-amino-4-hydroxy-6-hydroxymethyldihydropteridine diphosphokinase|nr:2-amino-4-hydroxy-6-hydroxymethyldihydropteridine diphosphokinase [Flavobacteriales bacterium]